MLEETLTLWEQYLYTKNVIYGPDGDGLSPEKLIINMVFEWLSDEFGSDYVERKIRRISVGKKVAILPVFLPPIHPGDPYGFDNYYVSIQGRDSGFRSQTIIDKDSVISEVHIALDQEKKENEVR